MIARVDSAKNKSRRIERSGPLRCFDPATTSWRSHGCGVLFLDSPMRVIAPIETQYGGCTFRSRLEARWAFAFDALEISWEYEREGFQLETLKYLPDFWLNHATLGWIEVKPTWEAAKAEEAKLAEFRAAVDESFYVICGPPGKGSNVVCEIINGKLRAVRCKQWSECAACGFISIVGCQDLECFNCGLAYEGWSLRSQRLALAFSQAQGEKFEFHKTQPKQNPELRSSLDGLRATFILFLKKVNNQIESNEPSPDGMVTRDQSGSLCIRWMKSWEVELATRQVTTIELRTLIKALCVENRHFKNFPARGARRFRYLILNAEHQLQIEKLKRELS